MVWTLYFWPAHQEGNYCAPQTLKMIYRKVSQGEDGEIHVEQAGSRRVGSLSYSDDENDDDHDENDELFSSSGPLPGRGTVNDTSMTTNTTTTMRRTRSERISDKIYARELSITIIIRHPHNENISISFIENQY